MLIPIFLTRAGGCSSSATSLLLAPLGPGMMCGYPLMGTLTKQFGIRKVSAGGAALALAGTLPFLYLASHGLVVAILACALFRRGMGMSAVGTPFHLGCIRFGKARGPPDANTALNIVMRLGGPTLTMVCATFLVGD